MKPPTNLWLDLFKIALNRLLPLAPVPLDAEEILALVAEAGDVADAASAEVDRRMEHFKPPLEVRTVMEGEVMPDGGLRPRLPPDVPGDCHACLEELAIGRDNGLPHTCEGGDG